MRILEFIKSRTYIEILATLHLIVMSTIAYNLYDISNNGIESYISGIDTSVIESELSGINSKLDDISDVLQRR